MFFCNTTIRQEVNVSSVQPIREIWICSRPYGHKILGQCSAWTPDLVMHWLIITALKFYFYIVQESWFIVLNNWVLVHIKKKEDFVVIYLVE